jgi:GNAT superfamily N-acetyltransferase
MLDSLRDRERASGDFFDVRWPAHLHVNLLPEARGTGLGSALMARWLAALREDGSRGCHLATLVENVRAGRFFERSAFRNHGEATLIAGMRDRSGQRLHQQIMVRDSAIDPP